MKSVIRRLGVGLALPILCAVAKPLSAATLFSETVLIEGDQFTGVGFAFDSTDTTDTAFVSDSTSHDLEPVGSSGMLTFQGEASATSAIQRLRSSVSGSIENSFFDENFNDAEGAGDIPTRYTAQSVARFSETLQYESTATNYTSRYILRLTGDISGAGYAGVTLTHGSEAPQFWLFVDPGPIDMTISSSAYVHGLSPQTFTLELFTIVSFETEFMPDGSSDSGSARFGNTLEVVGIDLRDENGILAAPGTVTGDSGSTYNIIPVPEPAVVSMAGLVAIGCCMKRRRF